MVHHYNALLVAVVAKTAKEKSAVVRTISEVLKTAHHRARPGKYRMAHPEDETNRHSFSESPRTNPLPFYGSE